MILTMINSLKINSNTDNPSRSNNSTEHRPTRIPRSTVNNHSLEIIRRVFGQANEN